MAPGPFSWRRRTRRALTACIPGLCRLKSAGATIKQRRHWPTRWHVWPGPYGETTAPTTPASRRYDTSVSHRELLRERSIDGTIGKTGVWEKPTFRRDPAEVDSPIGSRRADSI